MIQPSCLGPLQSTEFHFLCAAKGQGTMANTVNNSVSTTEDMLGSPRLIAFARCSVVHQELSQMACKSSSAKAAEHRMYKCWALRNENSPCSCAFRPCEFLPRNTTPYLPHLPYWADCAPICCGVLKKKRARILSPIADIMLESPKISDLLFKEPIFPGHIPRVSGVLAELLSGYLEGGSVV